MMTGLVLAGGQSRRMGADKAQLAWKNGTMLTAAVDKLAPMCREIVIVGPQKELPRTVRWTKDHYVGAGPLAGLHAGLQAASFDSVLVLPCDMPAVPVSVLAEMVRLSKNADIVIPVHAHGYEPLCAWYRRSTCLPASEQLLKAGCSRLQAMLQQVRVVEWDVDKTFQGAGERYFLNLNTRSDYENAMVQLTEKVAGVVG